MLSSIHPFGERSRNSRWWLTVAAYGAGSISGGAVSGTVFGAIGQLALQPIPPAAALFALGGVAALAAAADRGLVPVRPPGPRRQVNERWLMAYRGWVYGLGFGFQLGLGLATIVTTMTVWSAWAAAALTADWRAGLAIGAVFGAVRASVILAGARVETPAALRRLHRRIAAGAEPVQRATVLTAGLTAITAVATGALA